MLVNYPFKPTRLTCGKSEATPAEVRKVGVTLILPIRMYMSGSGIVCGLYNLRVIDRPSDWTQEYLRIAALSGLDFPTVDVFMAPQFKVIRHPLLKLTYGLARNTCQVTTPSQRGLTQDDHHGFFTGGQDSQYDVHKGVRLHSRHHASARTVGSNCRSCPFALSR